MLKRVKTNKNYKFREIAGEYYLISVGTEVERTPAPVQLTETAAWLWRQMEAGVLPAKLPEKMTEEYDIDLTHARESVRRFLADLLRMRMVEPESAQCL